MNTAVLILFMLVSILKARLTTLISHCELIHVFLKEMKHFSSQQQHAGCRSFIFHFYCKT